MGNQKEKREKFSEPIKTWNVNKAELRDSIKHIGRREQLSIE